VDDERVSDEAVLAPGAALRFGEVTVLFDPADTAPAAPGRPTTEMVPPVAMDAPTHAPSPRRPVAPPPAPSPRRSVAPPPAPPSSGRWVVWVLVLAAIAAAAVLLLG
jgi:hypothetical protein